MEVVLEVEVGDEIGSLSERPHDSLRSAKLLKWIHRLQCSTEEGSQLHQPAISQYNIFSAIHW